MAVSEMKGLTLAVRHMFAPPGDHEHKTATLSGMPAAAGLAAAGVAI